MSHVTQIKSLFFVSFVRHFNSFFFFFKFQKKYVADFFFPSCMQDLEQKSRSGTSFFFISLETQAMCRNQHAFDEKKMRKKQVIILWEMKNENRQITTSTFFQLQVFLSSRMTAHYSSTVQRSDNGRRTKEIARKRKSVQPFVHVVVQSFVLKGAACTSTSVKDVER